MTVTNNIYQKQIKYHVFNAVTNSKLTELVPVFTIRPAFPTSVKKVNTSFNNVWRTWGPALPTLLADLMIFCPLGPMNFKNCVYRDDQYYWWRKPEDLKKTMIDLSQVTDKLYHIKLYQDYKNSTPRHERASNSQL
jgi:hypothetical protein